MKWISVKEQLPPKETILVYGKCGIPHVAIYDYNEYCHTECCYEDGHHFTGESIDFEYWMPLPVSPHIMDKINLTYEEALKASIDLLLRGETEIFVPLPPAPEDK